MRSRASSTELSAKQPLERSSCSVTTPKPDVISLAPSDQELLPNFVSAAHKNVSLTLLPRRLRLVLVIGRKSQSFHRRLDWVTVFLDWCWFVEKSNSLCQRSYRSGTTILTRWYRVRVRFHLPLLSSDLIRFQLGVSWLAGNRLQHCQRQ
jgi:hypothetical protein